MQHFRIAWRSNRVWIIGLALIGLSLASPQAVAQPPTFSAVPQPPTHPTERRLDVRVQAFGQVTTSQFSMQWPADVATFQSVTAFGLPGLSAANFHTAAPGVLTFSWDDATLQGISLPDGAVLFTLVFAVLADVAAPLRFADAPTPIEVTRQLQPVAVQFDNGTIGPACVCP